MRHSMRAGSIALLATAVLGLASSPAPATTPKRCVGAEEARVRAAGDDEGPPNFTPPFYRRLLVLDASLDGADGKELPISIEEVCNVPRRLKRQAAQLAGSDGVALLLARTTVWQDGQQVAAQEVAAALDGADTAFMRVRLKHPRAWSKDEDGNPVPTFRAGRIEITD